MHICTYRKLLLLTLIALVISYPKHLYAAIPIHTHTRTHDTIEQNNHHTFIGRILSKPFSRIHNAKKAYYDSQNKRKANNNSIWGICALVSITGAGLVFWAMFSTVTATLLGLCGLFCIASIILSAIGIHKDKRRGFAIAGLALGITITILWGFAALLLIAFGGV